MLKNLVVLLLGLGVCQGAKAGAKPWPGVEYKTVKVYLYNLNDRLFGQHQPVKEGKLDTSVIQPGVTLNQEQLDKVLKLSNENTNLLEIGLASCYLPHHAFVFFDADDKPVAYISICFMCDAARFFPFKKGNPNETINPKKEKVIQDQLYRLKQIVLSAGLPIYAGSIEYNGHRTMLNYPVKDTVKVEWNGFTQTQTQSFRWIKDGHAAFSSCSYIDDSVNPENKKTATPTFKSATKDSMVRIINGGNTEYSFSIESPFSEVSYSQANNKYWPNYARITENCFGAVLKNIQVDDYKFKLIELLRANNKTPANARVFVIRDTENHTQYTFLFENDKLSELNIDAY